MTEHITFTDFTKIDMRVGTILAVKPNVKARIPAYVMEIDFGSLGIKTSSAQITKHYSAEDLIGKQVIAVVNFPVKRIAGIKSEVLVLGGVQPSNEADIILLQPERNVANGTPIA